MRSTMRAIVDLPDAGKPVNHTDTRPLSLELRTHRLVGGQRLTVNICGPSQRELDHARGRGLVAVPINQDEGARIVIVLVCIERHR